MTPITKEEFNQFLSEDITVKQKKELTEKVKSIHVSPGLYKIEYHPSLNIKNEEVPTALEATFTMKRNTPTNKLKM